MFSWNKIINVLKRRRGNVNPFTTFKPFGWKCCKTIGSYFSCVFIEIWSTWEVWRALKKLELVSKLPACFVCRWTHADLRTIVNFHIRTSRPLLDSYATIGIKKNLFHFTYSWKTSGQRHKLNDSSVQKWENEPRSSMNWNFLLWLEKGKE